MKIIDLLNKIANNEEIPTRIRYKNEIYKVEYNSIFKQNYYEIEDKYSNRLLLAEIHSVTQLNEEVEIIEEEKKIPEKLELQDDGNTITLFGRNANEWTILNNVDVLICDKINEIIDYLQSKGE